MGISLLRPSALIARRLQFLNGAQNTNFAGGPVRAQLLGEQADPQFFDHPANVAHLGGDLRCWERKQQFFVTLFESGRRGHALTVFENRSR